MLISVPAFLVSGCKGQGGKTAACQPLVSLVRPAPIVVAPPVVVQADPEEESWPLDLDIIPRSNWSTCAPIVSRLEPMGKVTRITIHHEGMDVESESSTSAVKEQLRKIQASHKDRMHAGDIGYHFVIDCNGRVWEGRPIKYQGAHAGNGDANRGNIGIVLMGNFEVQKPTRAQVGSLKALTSCLMSKYRVTSSRLYTHREIRTKYGIGDTDCPGRYLQREVDMMRKVLLARE
jgi:hypothetical protein